MAAIVFDVNETLLDLAGLDQSFQQVFGDRAAEVKRLWFARLLHTSTVMTTIGTWQDFGLVGKVVLKDLGDRLDLPVTQDQVDTILGKMTQLQPHDDVVPGLSMLRDAGARLVALTNSGQSTAEAQIRNAGLTEFFASIMGVDAVLRFKPDRAVYDHAREQLEEDPADLVMVATHDWDCAGAMKAGWHAAFVVRPGQTYNPVLQPPTYRGDDMVAVATTLIEAGAV